MECRESRDTRGNNSNDKLGRGEHVLDPAERDQHKADHNAHHQRVNHALPQALTHTSTQQLNSSDHE